MARHCEAVRWNSTGRRAKERQRNCAGKIGQGGERRSYGVAKKSITQIWFGTKRRCYGEESAELKRKGTTWP